LTKFKILLHFYKIPYMLSFCVFFPHLTNSELAPFL
jgi:hypothetical protein